MATATQAPAEMLVNQSENEFEYLFHQYWQRGFHFALQTVGNREDAMDLAQEAFLHPPALGSKGLRPAVCTVVLQDSSQPSDRSTQKTSFKTGVPVTGCSGNRSRAGTRGSGREERDQV